VERSHRGADVLVQLRQLGNRHRPERGGDVVLVRDGFALGRLHLMRREIDVA
jgi:hypothetical protein